MATEVKFRRGTTAEHSTFTGALGEMTVDTDRDELVLHDGVLAGGFRIRNNRVRLAPHGEVHLAGTGKQPVLTGSIFATEGTVTLPHLRLAVAQGQLTFPEEDPFHPRLEFQGSGRIGIYEVTLKARGDPASPEVELSSVPGLPREELLALVATGLTPRELRRQGVESVAAVELLKVYGAQVWEEIFGQSTGEGFVKHVEVTTEQAEKEGFPRYPHPHCDHGWIIVPLGDMPKAEEFPTKPEWERFGAKGNAAASGGAT